MFPIRVAKNVGINLCCNMSEIWYCTCLKSMLIVSEGCSECYKSNRYLFANAKSFKLHWDISHFFLSSTNHQAISSAKDQRRLRKRHRYLSYHIVVAKIREKTHTHTHTYNTPCALLFAHATNWRVLPIIARAPIYYYYYFTTGLYGSKPPID